MDLFKLRDWRACPLSFQDSKDAYIDEVHIHSKLISSKNALFVCLAKKEHQIDEYLKEAYKKGAKFALVPKGVQENKDYPRLLSVENPLVAFQSLARDYRKTLPCKVIAIMGAYGKTLLKDLLFTIYKTKEVCVASPESFNSQIGVPLSIFSIDNTHNLAFIEAAASEPGEISRLSDILCPNGIIYTALSDTHPYIYKSQGKLKEEHFDLIQKHMKEAWFLIESESSISSKNVHYWDQPSDLLPDFHIKTSTHSDLNQCCYSHKEFKQVFTIPAAHSLMHNLFKIAVKASFLLDVDPKSVIDTIQSYQFELRKREIWKSPTGSIFQNDPYVSRPLSFLNSLSQFERLKTPGKKWIVFNGFKDLGAYSEVHYDVAIEILKTQAIDQIIIYSDKIPLSFEEKLKIACPKITCSRFLTLEMSLKFLQSSLSFEDAILILGSQKVSSQKISNFLSLSLASNQLLIDLTAIKQNINLLKAKLGENKRLMPIIKSQAYGTDSVIVALFLETCGIEILGVAYVSEALQLRRHGVSKSIFILHANESELEEVVKWDLEIAVSNENILISLQKIAKNHNKIIKVHLHVDTGMTRFGCPSNEALALAKKIHSSSNIEFHGLMTHFAQSEDASGDAFTLEQAKTLSNLNEALKKRHLNPPWVHAENSAAIVRFSFPSFNMVRAGLALFGLLSFSKEKMTLPLKPALSLRSRISAVHTCKKGDTVSYGRCYTVKKEHETIAVIPLGYFDGIHRHYAKNGKVLIQNKLAPVVGSICMDFMMVNTTDIPDVKVGDSVLIFGSDKFGNEVSAQEFAKNGQTIAHELITCLGPRIQRIFTSDEHAHPIPQIKEQAQWTAKQTLKK